MSAKYILSQKGNLSRPNEPEKCYVKTKRTGAITLKSFLIKIVPVCIILIFQVQTFIFQFTPKRFSFRLFVNRYLCINQSPISEV
jgi:hypothetical protein